MKKIIGCTVVAGLIGLFFVSGCGEESQKHTQDAKENVKEAGKDLKEAGKDLTEAVKDAKEETKTKAIADWQNFKHESDSTIAVMEKQIQEHKDQVAKSNRKNKEKLKSDLNKAEQRLNEHKEKLKQKNSEFEMGLKKFDESVTAKNESFEREFKHDMNELGTAFQNLFKDNVK